MGKKDKDAIEVVDMPDYFRMEIGEAVQLLNSSLENGLTTQEAELRLAQYGPNALKAGAKISPWRILFGHLFNFMSFVLIAATALSLAAKQYIDAVVIGSIIVINTVIGFIQEYRSEKTMESLRKMSQPTSTVIRDGKQIEVSSETIVPGDIVILKEGDKVPADLRVVKAVTLECDEALLTGESLPIEKKVKAITKEGPVPVGDRVNYGFMSTTVTKGKGKGIVFATGRKTEIGKIADSLANAKKGQTKLEQRMGKLGRFLVVAAVVAIGLVLLGGWAWGTFDIYPEGLQTGISTAVAIIPEGLVPVVTLTLTLGVRKMAKERAIVRKINAIESLGNITNICTDKTGTLTQGKMVATNLWIANDQSYDIVGEGLNPEGTMKNEKGEKLEKLDGTVRLGVLIGSLCNASSIMQRKVEEDSNEGSEGGRKEWIAIGSPTEASLVVLGHKMKLDKLSLEDEWKFRMEFPFDSSIKRMSMVYTNNLENQDYLFLKGAPERVLSLCDRIIQADGSEAPLSDDDLNMIKAQNDQMAKNGLRVLSLSYKKLSETPQEETKREELEKEVVFVGLVGIKDPPREGVPESIAVCHKAGITVHMVTGDHPSTAKAIARQIGIIPAHIPDDEVDQYVTTAVEFDALSEHELRNLKVLPLVIARCSPESKVRMVAALHDRDKFVAMLGDGVNDSPAIKTSDVGVAMGMNGSDVTKEASDVVLTDDDFSTIVVAIREGRRIFANIRKFIVHLLAGNVAESIVLVIGVLCSLDPPLDPLQVLWVNMVTGTGPALALGIEPASRSIMDKNKRPVNEELFTKETIIDTFFYGTIMGILTLGNFIIFQYGFDSSLHRSQSVAFCSLTLLLLAHAYNCRNLQRSIFREGLFRAYWLHASVLFGIASICLTFYVPFFRDTVFDHDSPGGYGWLLSLGATIFFLAVSELYKIVKRPIRKRAMKKYVSKQEGLELQDVNVAI